MCKLIAMKVEKVFEESVLKDIGAAIVSAYRDAERLIDENSCFNFACGLDERANLYRAEVEEHLRRGLSNQSDFNLQVRLNVAENCHHVVLTYRERYIMTVARVKRQRERPREAIYRNRLCWRNQLELFNVPNDQETLSDQQLYLILTHGLNAQGIFAGIGIPTPIENDWYDYLLLDEYLQPATMVEEEFIQDASFPRLRFAEEENGAPSAKTSR